MRFDFTDLRLFCEVVDAGSITAGAERSALALAAASTRIRNMEAALGAPLLSRSRQGVSPTPAGRMLLKHARAMLAQQARMREDLSAYAGGLSGEVKVLANTNALTEFLPETLSGFLADHPHVSVDLEERLSDEIVGLIAEGVGDIGIVAGTVEVGRLQTYPFRSDRFVVVTAKDHPLAARKSVGFAEVLDFDFVGLERSSSLQRFLTAKAVREGRPLKLRVQLRSFDAVCRLVECGVGVGVVPETTAARAARTMSLGVVALADDWALRELRIVVRAEDELRPYARELVAALKSA
ncbi:transcriptional regulator, LysR family [Phenylobacterium zucineum HLK1]|uniref:Transcriptional regulator, LysR family n=1 Tax=Phenylobacterium zucineum (strain HLK1) TaxID=450851 RepID=B4RD19_PHEZH|nr:LysR substrate-binding domain-containing protein [Phenylobacterium zucineum]ACG76623.1 transcriptional regulator, LysR family [Phenylobacterium zucineum HLK1]